MDAHWETMEANMNAWQEGNKAYLQKMEVCLEKKERTPVEKVNVAAQLQKFNGVTHGRLSEQVTTNPGTDVWL
jgi:hypothetical protein